MAEDADLVGFGSSSGGKSLFSRSGVGAGLTAFGDLAGSISSFTKGETDAAALRAKAKGYEQESSAYTDAAGYAAGSVDLSEEATAIKQYQTQHLIDKTIGAQRAQVGMSGFGEGGSALYLLRSSMEQGALAKGLVGVQGEVQEQGYRAQQAFDLSLSKQADTAAGAAKDAASSAETGGVLGAIGGVVKAGAAVLLF